VLLVVERATKGAAPAGHLFPSPVRLWTASPAVAPGLSVGLRHPALDLGSIGQDVLAPVNDRAGGALGELWVRCGLPHAKQASARQSSEL